ncbi:MAG: alpha/beta fold hydrolase [Chloroflexota bacterium]
MVISRSAAVSDSVGGHFVRVGDTPVYYEVLGAGPPLVLIHGLSGSGRWWAKNALALAKHHRVFVVDLAGFGRSCAAQRVVLDECGAFLAQWMDAVELVQASIVGHSMGGFIAASLAADAPDRVDRLVLVNAAVLPLSHADLILRFGLARVLLSISPGFLPVLMTDGWRAGPLSVVGAARDLLQADIRAKLSRIVAPTLLLWGANDRLLPPELGRQLQTALPNAQLEVIDGAGHNPMWDRPDSFNRSVLAFLALDSQDQYRVTGFRSRTLDVHTLPRTAMIGRC